MLCLCLVAAFSSSPTQSSTPLPTKRHQKILCQVTNTRLIWNRLYHWGSSAVPFHGGSQPLGCNLSRRALDNVTFPVTLSTSRLGIKLQQNLGGVVTLILNSFFIDHLGNAIFFIVHFFSFYTNSLPHVYASIQSGLGVSAKAFLTKRYLFMEKSNGRKLLCH